MKLNCANRLFTLGVSLILVAGAPAQWTYVSLHPAGATASGARGVSNGKQVGYAIINGAHHASFWSGTSASWVDLHPAGAENSDCFAVSQGQQVGQVVMGQTHASLWTGTAASWVSLNPLGAIFSHADGVDGGQQVGSSVFSGEDFGRASVWSGTAVSWVDLHPPMATGSSFGIGVRGGEQVGYSNFEFGPPEHAGLWRGTSSSWVDLSPVTATRSVAEGIGSGQQAGTVNVLAINHASVWAGTATSWVDMNPGGASRSSAHATDGGLQVGEAVINSSYHASLWSGSAASWVDLQALLPWYFSSTFATAISHDAGNYYVVGNGLNSMTGFREAIMWTLHTQTVYATSTTLSPGIVVSGTPTDLRTSNDVYYTLRPGVVLSSSQSPIVLNANYTLPAGMASVLFSVVESRAQQANIRQTIEAFNFSTGAYVQFNQLLLPTTSPDTVTTSSLSPSENYIGTGNQVRLKISYKAVGPILTYPWRVFIDEATLRFAPQ